MMKWCSCSKAFDEIKLTFSGQNLGSIKLIFNTFHNEGNSFTYSCVYGYLSHYFLSVDSWINQNNERIIISSVQNRLINYMNE